MIEDIYILVIQAIVKLRIFEGMVLTMNIIEISNDLEKQNISRYILESLSDWFGIPDAREGYIQESAEKPFFCAYDGDTPIGFTFLWGSKNLKFFQHCGISIIRVKFM